MLEQVRRDHGEARLALVDDDLVATVRAVAEQFDALASERGIQLVIEAPEQVPARFDPERISRVISNLLANALRYAPAGGVVRCSLAAQGDTTVVEIADSGVGVPPEQRALLFERFRTADNGRGHSGTGLGLAIVKEFVALHGGTVARRRGARGRRAVHRPAAARAGRLRARPAAALAAARRRPPRPLRQGAPGRRAGRARRLTRWPSSTSRPCCSSTAIATAPRRWPTRSRAAPACSRPPRRPRRCAWPPTSSPTWSSSAGSTARAPRPRCSIAWRASGAWPACCASRWSSAAATRPSAPRLQDSGAQDFIAEPLAMRRAAGAVRPAARARVAAPACRGRRGRAAAAARRVAALRDELRLGGRLGTPAARRISAMVWRNRIRPRTRRLAETPPSRPTHARRVDVRPAATRP